VLNREHVQSPEILIYFLNWIEFFDSKFRWSIIQWYICSSDKMWYYLIYKTVRRISFEKKFSLSDLWSAFEINVLWFGLELLNRAYRVAYWQFTISPKIDRDSRYLIKNLFEPAGLYFLYFLLSSSEPLKILFDLCFRLSQIENFLSRWLRIFQLNSYK
jgi:hypothetical protein